ncbi:MAG: hypothetical protein Q9160_006096 [Pyrenula sp. 1 TL-2023]
MDTVSDSRFDNYLSAVTSTSSTDSSAKSGRSTARSLSSHNLLSSTAAASQKRKADQASAEHSTTVMDRASISMPPPSSKANVERRISLSGRKQKPPDHIASFSSASIAPTSVPATPDSNALAYQSPAFGSGKTEQATATTATHTTNVTTSSSPVPFGVAPISPPLLAPSHPTDNPTSTGQSQTSVSQPALATSVPKSEPNSEGPLSSIGPRSARSASRNPRRFSGSTATSMGSDQDSKHIIGKIGVCALDIKARSKPSRSILTRLQAKSEFDVIVFGDKVILDEAVEDWPICDFLISFFSEGFPLDKAIAYAKLRKPFLVNDLSMQKVLWDRRLCLRILDKMGVPTPKRVEVNRDGGPRLESAELAAHVYKMTGVALQGPEDGTGGGAPTTQKIALINHGDEIIVDGKTFKKPFVEKPVSGEDHNVHIYFPRSKDGSPGGARRLFRKIGNKSSEFEEGLIKPRAMTEPGGSYLYEEFLPVQNAEDVKAYTVGPGFCHAETRKSPVVDGLVRRNNQGKELRYITNLTQEEATMASKIASGFGQHICGFDLLRAGGKSYVIDVNGWSFVKDNSDYYDRCASILRETFIAEKAAKDGKDAKESKEREAEEVSTHQPPHRRDTNTHRTVLHNILKSPSMSKLQNSVNNHLPHHRQSHGTVSPSNGTTSAPLTSPPSREKMSAPNLPSLADADELLPPPIVTTSNQGIGSMTSTPATPGLQENVPMPSSKHSWKLKGMVSVIRHADRTPKQKFKFTFHSQPFVDLLKGHTDEVLLKTPETLTHVENAVKIAMQEKLEDPEKLNLLRTALTRKTHMPGTKVQIKPMFRKRTPEEMPDPHAIPLSPGSGNPAGAPIPENDELRLAESPAAEHRPSLPGEISRMQTRSDSITGATFSRFSAVDSDMILDKLQLVMKWGGEPTHSARLQAQDLGVNMRDDLKLMNKEVLNDVRIFTSSERRVSTSANIWAASFLAQKDLPDAYINIRKDLLDDSNAAKDVMDKVKKKLKALLRDGQQAPEQFTWPKNTPEPAIVLAQVCELMSFHRRIMRHNFKKLNGSAAASLAAIGGNGDSKEARPSSKVIAEANASAAIQGRWCTGEDHELFKERWEKLFSEFCDSKVDPSKISELYDSMKFDALHNRRFLEWVFLPDQAILDEIIKEEKEKASRGKEQTPASPKAESGDSENAAPANKQDIAATDSRSGNVQAIAHKMGFRRRSTVLESTTPPVTTPEESGYFKLYMGPGDSKLKIDKRLNKLRELYRLGKILFDFIGPQEYGISDEEKLEIGLLTSLPLLREIVQDLEELQASGDAKSFIYFTKESHIYTLLNCILEGGISTKISRQAIPELDYLSQICFELYEARDDETGQFSYSIRISLSPGCHSWDLLDVHLDSKHNLQCAPRRSLTNHQDWKVVVGTLKEKFDTVKLPKSFLAVNLSEKGSGEKEDVGEEAERGREREGSA